MKKVIKKVALVLTLTGLSSVYAGGMGMDAISTEKETLVTPYVSIEGSYNWNESGDFTSNSISMLKTSHLWGGRASAGFLYSYSENLRFNGEIGGGYYGNIQLSGARVGTTLNISLDGYDILWGLLYKIRQFDVLGEVGFMTQNLRTKQTQDFSLSNPGGLYSGFGTYVYDNTQILPEIKVGGMYNLNTNLAISLAYMHVFGSDAPFSTSSYVATTTSISQNASQNTQNPTLNSIFLGLRYSFA